jgi:transposase
MCRPSPFFGGIPLSIVYDSLKIAVAKIFGDGKRKRTQAFTELVCHFLFDDYFGRPGEGNDKGKVEGLVKYSPADYLRPVAVLGFPQALICGSMGDNANRRLMESSNR